MYCTKQKIKANETVLWEPGALDADLFLLHTGAVGIFDKLPNLEDDRHAPEVIYKHGWFLNRQFLFREPARGYGVALADGELLSWNVHQWWRMLRDRPLMASAMMEMGLRQAGFHTWHFIHKINMQMHIRTYNKYDDSIQYI